MDGLKSVARGAESHEKLFIYLEEDGAKLLLTWRVFI